jgi:hypothetical protein
MKNLLIKEYLKYDSFKDKRHAKFKDRMKDTLIELSEKARHEIITKDDIKIASAKHKLHKHMKINDFTVRCIDKQIETAKESWISWSSLVKKGASTSWTALVKGNWDSCSILARIVADSIAGMHPFSGYREKLREKTTKKIDIDQNR